jgi:hypothetical protein
MKRPIPAIVIGLLILTASCCVLNAAEAPAARRIGVGLYGSNGHQLSIATLLKNPNAHLVAVAMVKGEIPAAAGIHQYPTLDALLAPNGFSPLAD